MNDDENVQGEHALHDEHTAEHTADNAQATDSAPDETTSRRRTAPRTKPARKPFERRSDPKPDDMVPISIPRSLLAEVLAERDRVDSPVDSLKRPRRQESKDAWGERLVRRGLAWAKTLPDWRDPLEFDQ